MTLPYQCEPDTYTFEQPEWDRKDLGLNFRPENACITFPTPLQHAIYWDPEQDYPHEADYGSEDLDFQPECFKTQHFKKKGFIWPWIVVGFMPFIYLWVEYLLQHQPDEDHWKRPLPPP